MWEEEIIHVLIQTCQLYFQQKNRHPTELHFPIIIELVTTYCITHNQTLKQFLTEELSDFAHKGNFPDLRTALADVFELKGQGESQQKYELLNNEKKAKLLQKKKEKEALIRQKGQEMLEKHHTKDIGIELL